MKIKKIKSYVTKLEEYFRDIEEDNIENGSCYDPQSNAVEFYKNLYLTILPKYKFLKKEWLYKEFLTRNIKNQSDKWILIGADKSFDGRYNIVWWDYNNRELFKDYSVEEFYTDIEENTYKICELN